MIVFKMMLDIKSKLYDLAAEPLDSEMKVVYFLVEIRKYIELEKWKKAFPVLNFFCCWALHSKAKGEGADRILRRFDESAHLLTVENTTAVPPTVMKEILETVSLSRFRADLKRFLMRLRLPTDIVTSQEAWRTLLKHYAQVTEDCPFVLSPSSKITLNNIKSVVIKRLDVDPMYAEPKMPGTSFRIAWTLIRPDDTEWSTVNISLTVHPKHALPTDSRTPPRFPPEWEIVMPSEP